MPLHEILAVALGLSMDALAVSVAGGMLVREERLRGAVLVALYFGGFQALMPVLGWAAGRSFHDLVAAWDHWAAFGLLAFVGAHMIAESLRAEPGERKSFDLGAAALLTLAVATSLDALAVGLSLAMLRVSVAVPALVIGAVTAAACFAGFLLGERLGRAFERRVGVLGGVILLAIGAKILVEHLRGTP